MTLQREARRGVRKEERWRKMTRGRWVGDRREGIV